MIAIRKRLPAMIDRTATADDVAGRCWCNSMAESEHGASAREGQSVTEAWDCEKHDLANGDAINIKAVY